ncbi:MAG: Trp family transcriptional regulator [Candidatus Kaiserbacteria bacterium]|nr:Trp family transcriptional regulator [Candidatus Kaiserbacteria bacterium]
MTHISKKRLTKKTQDGLFTQFVDLTASVKKTEQSKIFEALLTETELIMITKRLAIVLLLLEGRSTYAIAKTLAVSDSTVRLVRGAYRIGHYDSIIAVLRKKSFDRDAFWDTLEKILQCGLPPRGKGRWKWLYELPDKPRFQLK